MTLFAVISPHKSASHRTKSRSAALNMYTYNTTTKKSYDSVECMIQGNYFGGYIKIHRRAYDGIDKQLLYLQYNEKQQCIYIIDKTDDIDNTDIITTIHVNDLIRIQGQHFVANNLLYRNVYSIQLITTQYEIHVCTHNITTYKQWQHGLEQLITATNTHKRCNSTPFCYNTLSVKTCYNENDKLIQITTDDKLLQPIDDTHVTLMATGTTCNVVIETSNSTMYHTNTSVLYHRYSRQHKNGVILLYLPIDDCKSLLSIAIDSITDVYVGCYNTYLNPIQSEWCITLMTTQRVLHVEFNNEVIRDNWSNGLRTIMVNTGRSVSSVTDC